MKTPKSLYSRLALATSVTLVVGYFVVYAVYENINSEEVASNAIITSTLMGKIKNNLEDINTRVSNFGFSAGNVGIGTASPATKLYISGSLGGTYLTVDWVNWQEAGMALKEAGINKWSFYNNGNDDSLYLYNYTQSAVNIKVNPTTGNVGIGTVTPEHKLHIYSPTTSALVMDRPVGFFGWYQVRTSNSPRWVFGADATVESGGNVGSDFQLTAYTDAGSGLWNAMTIQRSTGNVGIWVLNPTYKLQVNGQPAANGYTAFVNYSDKRLKENISNITDGSLEKILKLRPVEYNYNNKYFGITGYDKNTKEKKLRWFIAQELKEVFPEMVGEKSFWDEKYLDTDLSNLQIYMVRAIQELNAKNLQLEKEIQELKNK